MVIGRRKLPPRKHCATPSVRGGAWAPLALRANPALNVYHSNGHSWIHATEIIVPITQLNWHNYFSKTHDPIYVLPHRHKFVDHFFLCPFYGEGQRKKF